jgi:hypothetical protein
MTKIAWATVFMFATLLGAPFILLGGPAAHAQGGPTVRVTAPANGAAMDNPVTISVETSGALIKAATENDPNSAHLHYFVDRDPATVLQPGQPIPSGQPDIIHTADTRQQLPTLSQGQHRVWVVLAHTDHTPYSPNVQAMVAFTLGAAAPAAPGQLPTTGDRAAASLSVVAAAALACLLCAAGLALLRRSRFSR